MTYGTNPTDNKSTPLGSVYVPNTPNSDLTVLEGIAVNIDGQLQKSAAVRLGLKDGDDATQGQKADPAATDTTSAWSIIALLKAILAKSATSTLSSVAAATSGVLLLASNTARRGMSVYNDSTAVMYLGFVVHASVTTTNYTTQVPANTLYEMPYPIYTGEISAIWGSAVGSARINELS